MRSRDRIVKDTIDTIKKDEKVSAYFFSKIKSLEPFLDLASEGFFSPSTIPKPIKTEQGYSLPFWPQATYLEHISELISAGQVTNATVVKRFVELLRSIVDVSENFLLGRSLFKCITNVPAEYLTEDDVRLMFGWVNPRRKNDTLIEGVVHEGLSNLIDNLRDDTHSHNILKLYLNYLFSIAEKEKDMGREFELAFFTNYGLKHFKVKYLKIEELYIDKPFVLEVFLSAANDLLEGFLSTKDIDNSSAYWRPAIEDHAQNEYHDSAQSVLVGLLYSISKVLILNGKVPQLINHWRDSKFITFNRLYIALGDISANLIPREDVAAKILDIGLESQTRHEAFHFLKNNFVYLSSVIQDKLLLGITSLEAEHADGPDEKLIFSSWMKKRWIQALEDIRDDRISKIYADLVSVIGDKKVDHPDFSSYMSSGWVGPNSPWTIDDFTQASADQIFDQLLKFENANTFREPTVEGLSRVFEDYIVADPAKVSKLIDQFEKLNYLHISSLFDGYSKAWGEKKFVPVDKLLSLALRLSESEKFRSDLLDEKTKAVWVVSSIARLILVGTKSDDNAFSPNVNIQSYKILINLIEVVRASSDYDGSSDSYTRAINEPRGKLFEALITLTLRRARLSDKGSSGFADAWADIVNVIEPILKLKDESEVSLFALMGAYYRQFLYLNEKWFFDNFDLIIPDPGKNERLWLSFMEGFGYVSAYVSNVYSKLQDRGYILKFLRFEEPSDKSSRFDRLQGRGIELGLISYVLGHETLERGLLASVIGDRFEDEWHHVIWSVRSVLGAEKHADHVSRIKSMIQALVKIRQSDDSQDWSKHFRGIDRLLDIFTDPSDSTIVDLIDIISADKSSYWEFDSVIDYFHKYKDSHQSVVARLFLQLLKASSSLPMWPEEKIKDILESLLLTEKTSVGEICRIYVDRGMSGEPIKSICDKLTRD